ncbi:tetratricopeptide repeat protein [Microcystis sp. M061S2]|uniref:tetratricopeptide repeat protein n=1 Tax=Microcystis sp. M061S2 TaxID=2771171 RepID=UPI002590B38C|nr:tetratricopeptide repeat protein [Microcystis sp. M061S2]
MYKRSLSLREQRLGENHPDVATSLNNLAELYKYQGRYAEAEPLYVRAIAIYQERLGENHPDTQKVRQNFMILLSRLSDEELQQRFPDEIVNLLKSIR